MPWCNPCSSFSRLHTGLTRPQGGLLVERLSVDQVKVGAEQVVQSFLLVGQMPVPTETPVISGHYQELPSGSATSNLSFQTTVFITHPKCVNLVLSFSSSSFSA